MALADVNSDFHRELNINFQDLLKLTNLCFNSNNYLNNFPQVFKETFKEYLFLLKNEKNSVAFCSLYPLSFSFGGKTRISAYCIGSVCTHPDYRNKGLAYNTIHLAEKKAKENSADFIFLFADNNKLYSKLGFTSVGKTFLASISKYSGNKIHFNNYMHIQNFLKSDKNNSSLNYYNHYELENLEESLKAKLWQFIIVNSHYSESILSYLEFKDILKIKNMSLYYCECDNKVTAISFLNKGDDFHNVIHANYFNDKIYALYLINYIFKQNKEKDLIFFPGVFHKEFESFFSYIALPLMSIKSLNEKKFPSNTLHNLCSNYSFFVNSLQGT